MLTRLVIHDVVLIDKLTINLSQGLNVFTGETGAGKSILLDALGLALGERSDAGLVKQGAAQASVTAEFSLPAKHPAHALASDQGLDVEDSVILRRVIGKDGKSRAFFNDQPISVSLLKQFGESLLEIHGQFETHGLLNPATHRGILDSYGDLSSLKQKVSSAYTEWKKTEEKLRDMDAGRTRAAAEEEFLRAAVAELDELAPESGEADQLAERRTALQHREKIADALQIAEQSLSGDRGATSTLLQAGKAVARIADKALALQEILASIDRATAEAAEASAHIEKFMAATDSKPDALQRIEERLFALRAMARKHNVNMDALPDLRAKLNGQLGLLTDQSDQLAGLRKKALASRNQYKKLADELSAARSQASTKLEKAIGKELPPLKLERAQFKIDLAQLSEDQWSGEGINRITFQASTNPGTAPGPLHKIASGGELARFMLALKVVLAANDPVSTMVFDEVDSGIGGATASAVGERLRRLAQHVQILVVTHSPQVSAVGTTHFRVCKEIRNKTAATSVETLDFESRREEIARMLAGNLVTDAARQAAASLIDNSQEIGVPQRKKTAR